MWGCELESSGSEYSSGAGSFEHDNGPSGSLKCR